MKLNSIVMRFAALFIDYEAESLPPTSRVVEYGYIVERLLKYQPGKVLDVGCTARSNFIPATLCFMGWEVYGLDMRNWKFEHPQFRFVREDVRYMSVPDEVYDYAYAVSTLEHVGLRGYYGNTKLDLDGDISAVHEIERVLKPEGAFIVTLPYAKHYSKHGGTRLYDTDRLERFIGNFKVLDKSFYVQDAKGIWRPIREEDVAEECVVLLELQK